MSEQLYSVKEAARVLSVNPRTVANLVKLGEITATKLGPRMMRISADELARYIEAKRQQPR